MASLKGLRIAVNAPNAATNNLLTSPGMIAECRRQATGIAQRVGSSLSRASDIGTAEKKRRYPVVRTMSVATSFKGTVRGGASVRGQKWALRRKDVENALGKDVEWKN
jgi:hypothetical protein